MPVRKPRRIVRKRRPKKPRRIVRRKMPMTRYKIPPAPFPLRKYARLNYCEIVSAAMPYQTITGVFQFQSSLYDPRYNAGGHQPMYFDQYAAIYKSYRVFGIKYHVSLLGTYDYGVFLWMKCGTDNSADTSLETLVERPDRRITQGAPGNRFPVVKGYYSVASEYGLSKTAVRNNAEFSALVNANPSKMIYLSPYLYHMHPSSSQTMTIAVKLTYYCEFFDRLDIAGS